MMKKHMPHTGLAVLSLFLFSQTYALSFAQGTIFLGAKTEAECTAQGGSFTEWYEEIYCTKAGAEVTVEATSFSDLAGSHVNYSGVTYVRQEGIVNGYPDGTFKPDATINRAELAKILVTANFDAEVIAQCEVDSLGFSDVPSDSWFAPFVCIAKQEGIIKGYADGTFKPGQSVNFVEAAKMISLSFGQTTNVSGENWYTPFVSALSNKKAIPLTINALSKNITRGEMAEMVYRLHGNVNNKDSLQFEAETLNNPIHVESTTQGTNPLYQGNVSAETEATVSVGTSSESGQYEDLNTADWEAALGKKMIALFFHADWCPSCRAVDNDIIARLDEIPPGSVVFKVDYDTETELRKQFGITQQHTVVFINTEKAATLRKAGFSFGDLLENL